MKGEIYLYGLSSLSLGMLIVSIVIGSNHLAIISGLPLLLVPLVQIHRILDDQILNYPDFISENNEHNMLTILSYLFAVLIPLFILFLTNIVHFVIFITTNLVGGLLLWFFNNLRYNLEFNEIRNKILNTEVLRNIYLMGFISMIYMLFTSLMLSIGNKSTSDLWFSSVFIFVMFLVIAYHWALTQNRQEVE